MMGLSELKNEIKDNSIKNVYLFSGREEYLKKYYLDKLINSVIPDKNEFNYIIMDKKEYSMNEYSDCFEGYPLLSEKKVVVIYNPIVFNKKGDFESFFNLLSDLPDYTVVIIYFDDSEFTENSALKRDLESKINSIGNFINIDEQNDSELLNWVSRHFKSRNKKVTNKTIKYFLSVTDNKMVNLLNEIEKLCSYAVTDEITEKHIDSVVSKTFDYKIYNLTSALLERNNKESYEILNELLFQKYEGTYICGSIYNYFINLYNISVALSEGKTKNEIAFLFKMKPETLYYQVNICGKYSKDFFGKCLLECEKTDSEIKIQYGNEKTVLTKFIASIINLERKDDA